MRDRLRVGLSTIKDRLLPASEIIRQLAFHIDTSARASYAQEGEDRLLARAFEGRTNGFYVDVGAHDPRRFSNTCIFYQMGWCGINIEPSPQALERFRQFRRRDVNISAGIAETEGELTYYIFNDPALNTFDKDLASERESRTAYRIVQTIMVPVRRLESVLRQHVPNDTAIDFLSVDAEGWDLQVLKSNDWTEFRPQIVLAEALDTGLSEIEGTPLHQFMQTVGYRLFGKTVNTLFYRRSE